MLRILTVLSIIFFLTLLQSTVINQRRQVIWYTDGEAIFVHLKNGKVVDDKPLGVRAALSYDTFFKSYYVSWVDEAEKMVLLKFEFIKTNPNGSVWVRESKTNELYFLNESDLKSKGIVTIGIGERSSANGKIVSEDSRIFLLRNLTLTKTEDK